jgi:hypothetical protein
MVAGMIKGDVMRAISRTFFAISVMLIVAGCGSTWSTSNVIRAGQAGPTGAAATPKSEILVTEDDITDKKYRVIGDISVDVNKTTIFDSDPTPAHVDEKLREEAYKLGADAVVLVRYGSVGIGLMSWGTLEGKGRAVAYVD